MRLALALHTNIAPRAMGCGLAWNAAIDALSELARVAVWTVARIAASGGGARACAIGARRPFRAVIFGAALRAARLTIIAATIVQTDLSERTRGLWVASRAECRAAAKIGGPPFAYARTRDHDLGIGARIRGCVGRCIQTTAI